jgi:hypothetical protein
MPLPNMKFQLGRTMATQGALGALDDNALEPIVYLARHVRGDWGALSDDDRARNEAALIPDPATGECDRILSVYSLPDGQRIWIITEWDRSKTTILVPSEY